MWGTQEQEIQLNLRRYCRLPPSVNSKAIHRNSYHAGLEKQHSLTKPKGTPGAQTHCNWTKISHENSQSRSWIKKTQKTLLPSLDMRPPLPIPPFQPRSVHAKQIYSTTTTLGVPIPSLPSTQQTKRRPRTATNFKKTHSDVLIKTKFPVDNETIPHKACCRCAKCSMIGGLFEGMRRGAELTSGRTPLAWMKASWGRARSWQWPRPQKRRCCCYGEPRWHPLAATSAAHAIPRMHATCREAWSVDLSWLNTCGGESIGISYWIFLDKVPFCDAVSFDNGILGNFIMVC